MLKSTSTNLILPLLASGCLFLSACGGSSGDSGTQAGQSTTGGGPESTVSPAGPTLGGDDDEPEIPAGDDERPMYVTPRGTVPCSIEDINGRIDFDMRDYYIYYDQVPSIESAEFDRPEDVIRALRVDPDIYSFVADTEERDTLVEEGRIVAFGFSFSPASDGVVRFREVLDGSPAESAGLLRGDELIRLNGNLIGNYSDEELGELLGEDALPISMEVRTSDQPPRQITTLVRGEFRWRTAGPAIVLNADDLPTVGLLPVKRFLETTEAEIDASIRFLAESGIDELIIDLRYNPGGRARVSRRLASQIIGSVSIGEPFLVRRWNEKYSERNSTSTLEAAEPSLALSRVIVLLTEFSVSASESFVNGLEPYMDVVVIGGRTKGKIFTSNSRDYCGKSINAMRSIRTNSVGVSVQGGIQPDCSVADDWTGAAASVDDPLTSAATTFIASGRCPGELSGITKATSRSQSQGPSFFEDNLSFAE